MKYAEERGGMATSVHDWKPCPPDRFAKLMHQYTTQYGDEWGHGALTMTAMKLDRISTCTIFYYPQDGKIERKVRSPVLMTVSMIDGKVITFESLKYGVNAPEDGFRDEHGNKVSPDGVKIIETGMNFRTQKAQTAKITDIQTTKNGGAKFEGTLTTLSKKTDAYLEKGYVELGASKAVKFSAPDTVSWVIALEPFESGGQNDKRFKITLSWAYHEHASLHDGFEIKIGNETFHIGKEERTFQRRNLPYAKEYPVSITAFRKKDNGQIVFSESANPIVKNDM